jgi:transposase InsO family protein
MAIDDKMTIDERRKYLHTMKKRYEHASQAARGLLLNEMEAITGLHRKSLLRLLHQPSLARQARCRQRGRTYGPAVDDALRVIADSLDHICAERLQPNLVELAQHLAAHGELTVTPAVLVQLGEIGVSTLRRHLQRLAQDQPRLPRRGPEQANRVARHIPMTRIPWDETQPGHFEIDLVHHSGPSTTGEYVHTLQMIDVATGWSERWAILGRSYTVMADALRGIMARLPFPILEIHSDNGSEFLNAHLVRFWHELVPGVQLSRSRPYHKNDNRFVEQRNATLVRAYLGHGRLDSVAQTLALNYLYTDMGLYYSCFQPVMHLAAKTIHRNADGTSRIQRCYDTARTPLARLLATQVLDAAQALQLTTRRAQTNPRQLRQAIYDQLQHLFTLPGAVPGHTEDVYQTLLVPPILPKGEEAPVTLSFERMARPSNIII